MQELALCAKITDVIYIRWNLRRLTNRICQNYEDILKREYNRM